MGKKSDKLINEIEKLNNKIKELEEDNLGLTNKISLLRAMEEELNERIRKMTDTHNRLSCIIDYLCRDKFVKDNGIEFAAIKTYRDGWISMYFDGKELTPAKNDDVTIWADPTEKMRVEISMR